MTLADFILDPDKGMQCKLDARTVDPAKLKRVLNEFTSDMGKALKNTRIQGKRKLISNKEPGHVSGWVASAKKRTADFLWINTVEMPSMPGHDAGWFGNMGIPVSMTFVRHDGVSHNPKETVEEKALNDACQLSHAFLDEMLEFSL
jgi:acetylornithine deacetylase/succinyl-diaminopimelate desuccinylase-like protein